MMWYLVRFAQVIGRDDISGVPTASAGPNLLRTALQSVLGIFAALAVLFIAFNAFKIIISRGNSQDVAKARDGIIYAAIGLVVCMAAFFIVGFVVGNI